MVTLGRMLMWVSELVHTDSAAPEELEEASHGGRLTGKRRGSDKVSFIPLVSCNSDLWHQWKPLMVPTQKRDRREPHPLGRRLSL